MTTLLTPEAYCEFTGISTSKAAKDRMNGTGANFVKLGRLVRYPVESVQEYLQNNLRKSTSDPGK